jgi:hypothetical protein
MTEDMLEEAQEEDVARKIAWYKQQVVEAKDAFIRCLEELGYTVEVREEPITITEGLSGPYTSLEYLLTLHGKGELDGAELRLSPLGVWWLGTQGMISLKGRFDDENIGFFQKDGILSKDPDGIDYGYVTEDAWYWEKRGIHDHPARLSRNTVATLARRVS